MIAGRDRNRTAARPCRCRRAAAPTPPAGTIVGRLNHRRAGGRRAAADSRRPGPSPRARRTATVKPIVPADVLFLPGQRDGDDPLELVRRLRSPAATTDNPAPRDTPTSTTPHRCRVERDASGRDDRGVVRAPAARALWSPPRSVTRRRPRIAIEMRDVVVGVEAGNRISPERRDGDRRRRSLPAQPPIAGRVDQQRRDGARQRERRGADVSRRPSRVRRRSNARPGGCTTARGAGRSRPTARAGRNRRYACSLDIARPEDCAERLPRRA